MSNSTDANFLLQAFETRFYIILLLGCLWHSSVLKWAWFFLLAQIALWRVQRVRKSMRRIDQWASAEYSPRSSKRLKAIRNLSSVEVHECKHTNVNAVDG